VYVTLVLASTLFGTDIERLMAPAFLVVYLLVGTLLDGDLDCRGGFAILLIGAGVIGSLHHVIGAWTLPDRSHAVTASIVSILLGTGCAVAARVAASR
jgi:hypothetical protein